MARGTDRELRPFGKGQRPPGPPAGRFPMRNPIFGRLSEVILGIANRFDPDPSGSGFRPFPPEQNPIFRQQRGGQQGFGSQAPAPARPTRRPTLPGVRRAAVPVGRFGASRGLQPGLEAFLGPAGITPPGGIALPGGTTRGTPQQRTDLAARTTALQRIPPGTPLSHVPGHVSEGVGAGDPVAGLGQPGPNAGIGSGIADRFNPFNDPSRSRPDVPGFLGDAGRAQLHPGQGGPGVQFPQASGTAGFQSLDAAGIAARRLDPRTGRPLSAPEDQRIPGFSGTVAPPPFQSFDDFFAARRFRTGLETQQQNPFPFGGGNRLTPEQGRQRAAGEPFGESTFISQPGQAAGGVGPGIGEAMGTPGPTPFQAAGPPTGVFGSGGVQGAEPVGSGAVGLNAGLIEQQGLYAALREKFMSQLIPLALGAR